MPRRTRSSTRTTAIRPPIERVAPNEIPTLSLTPVEVDAIVQSAASADMTASDAGSRETVESYRIAMGSSSIEAPEVSKVEPPSLAAPIRAAATARVARLRPATPPAEIRSPQLVDARGPRRAREALRADTIRLLPQPPRKR